MSYKSLFKQIIDYTASIVSFTVLLPLFVMIMVLLLFNNQGTPFFTQSRPGKNGKIFTLIKFKTMNDKRGIDGNLLPDSDRLTSMGKLIRATSLDEIPQLLNVIKGDMSLVGPRPLLVEYLPLYNDEQARRHEVKPGITGWAQVNGRNAISWKNKFEFDVWYVDNVTFLLDLKIVLMTLLKVIRTEGVSSNTSVTMEKFTGK